MPIGWRPVTVRNQPGQECHRHSRQGCRPPRPHGRHFRTVFRPIDTGRRQPVVPTGGKDGCAQRPATRRGQGGDGDGAGPRTRCQDAAPGRLAASLINDPRRQAPPSTRVDSMTVVAVRSGSEVQPGERDAGDRGAPDRTSAGDHSRAPTKPPAALLASVSPSMVAPKPGHRAGTPGPARAPPYGAISAEWRRAQPR